MKNFDLEAAKRGAAVCTRGGFPVRIICWNMKCKSYGDMDRIVYLTDYTGDEHLSSCWLNGSYLTSGAMDKSDLMMRDDDYLEKLEQGEYDHIGESTEKVDWEYWRKLYAGMAMQGFCRESTSMNPASIIASLSVEYANVLIEELKKTQK